MWVLFLILILFVILLVFFAAGPTQSTRPHLRSEQQQVPLPQLPGPKPQPHIKTQPKFEPGSPLALEDFFVPVAKINEVAQPLWFSEAEINTPLTSSPSITGRESFDWDAQCRLTGQIYRVCSCEECKALRAQHGVG
jgi:hypothetical protein